MEQSARDNFCELIDVALGFFESVEAHLPQLKHGDLRFMVCALTDTFSPSSLVGSRRCSEDEPFDLAALQAILHRHTTLSMSPEA